MQSEHINTINSFTNIPEKIKAYVESFQSPFYSSSFFQGLETSSCVGPERGWQPCHFYSSPSKTEFFLPGYLKYHSYGEYVFDWSIADALSNAGFQYYPKWVMQLPFTPIEIADAISQKHLPEILDASLQEFNRLGLLTAQYLYVPGAWLSALQDSGALIRRSIFFKWQNKDFKDFDDFLDSLTQKRAKECRRERRKVLKSNFIIDKVTGEDITDELIEQFYLLYRRTYLMRSGHEGYLNLSFFRQWLMANKNRALIVTASRNQQLIAAALFLFDQHTLYGRYWGSLDRDSGLHFECCFYQGMEFCIERGLPFFNPGVQGEHKVRRGFEPYLVNSAYYYFHAPLIATMKNYFNQEKQQLDAYLTYLQHRLPFKPPTASP